MNRRIAPAVRNFLIGMALGLLLLLVLGGAAYLLLRDTGPATPGPAVTIRAPHFGDQVLALQTTIVSAMASDPRGVTRVELWIDQQLLAVQTSELPKGSTPYPLSYAWYPEQPGAHVLIVRAYNSAGGAGQATLMVDAVLAAERAAQMSYLVAEGDTLGGIAERFGVTPEGLAAENPGLADPPSPGSTLSVSMPPTEPEGAPAEEPPPPEPLPGEAPPDPMFARPAVGLERLASILPLGGAASGAWVEVEALSMEVDKEYDGVYCYYSLAGAPFERVPADGYLESAGSRRWGLEGAMGGDHRRSMLLAEDTSTFDIRGNCVGYRASGTGGVAFDLGTLTVSHTLAEADGSTILKEVSGAGGWFRVEYSMHVVPTAPSGTPPRPRTAEEPPTLPAPSLSGSCDRGFLAAEPSGWAVECQLVWRIPADATGSTPWADGFLLLRNGAVQETLPRTGSWRKTLEGFYPALAPTIVGDGWMRIAGEWGDLPAPGDTYNFQIVYYQGSPYADPPAGYRSPPSNIFTLTGDMWPDAPQVTVTIQALQVDCIWADRDRIGLCTEGLGSTDYDSTGMPTGGCSDYCSGSPEDWGPGAYGGIDVMGERVLNIGYPIWSGGRYTFPPSFGTRATPSITLPLSPFQYLVVESRMWDYDVFYHDDAFCHGLVSISPEELQHIRDGAMQGWHVSEFSGGEGLCYLGYTVEVR